ncbi:MAG: sugar-binding domain-containing protein, partial [Candidatus Saccharibacteria bacterium]
MKKVIRFIPIIGLCLLLLVRCMMTTDNSRKIQNFGKGWKFNLGDVQGAEQPEFDDTGWRILNLPHDWSIEGEFSDKNPATVGGGALPGGVGWYRKSFVLPETEDQVVLIDFDGIYQNSEVWINGHSLGKRHYGYSSFRYDLTPYLTDPGIDNVIAVRVDNSEQPNSRWYSGSGIYRNVWLTTTGMTHIDHWGTYITTPEIKDSLAKVRLMIQIRNQLEEGQELVIRTVIKDPSGKDVATGKTETDMVKDSIYNTTFDFEVSNPSLWNVDSPMMYKAVTEIYVDGYQVDKYTTPFGIRSFEFTADRGFFLNGKPIKINGVCDHHDLGCLGAAI